MEKIESRIIKGIGGFYYVKPTDSLLFNNEIIECKPRGKLKLKNDKLKVGDYVLVAEDKNTNQWVIEKLESRKNTLIRPPVSNVDIGLICIAARNPNPDLTLLDKLLINCLANEIKPIICLTKSDLKDEKTEELFIPYIKAGFDFVELSSEQEDDFKKLLNLIKGHTAFMAGPSGAGKSTLSNRLCEKQMEVGEISRKLDRGKHTTRHVELLETNYDSYLLDTPGFTSLEVEEDIEADLIPNYYPEFLNYECRFSDCKHINEPNCGVKEALEDGKIDKDRYERYKFIYKTINERKKKY